MRLQSSGQRGPLTKFVIIALIILFIIWLARWAPYQSQETKSTPNPVSEAQRLHTCLANWKEQFKDDPTELNEDPKGCPKAPPDDLRSNFTLNGSIDVAYQWKCQTGPDYHKEHTYSLTQVSNAIANAELRMSDYYGRTDYFLYTALDLFPIQNKSVAIMGSQRPTYESVCVVFNASSCTTIEYQKINMDYPNMKAITVSEYDENPQTFDAAISISSFEHDGLGRYGDPLKPNGDLSALKKMTCTLKEDGLLFLSVPIGMDKIVWNMHRIYGQKRLPMLLEDWTLLEVIGDFQMYERWSGCDPGVEGDYEPIFILQNRRPKPGANVALLNRYLIPNYTRQACRPIIY